MIKIDANYTDYREDGDPGYPMGKAVDASTPESLDGTPYKKEWMDDVNGFRQALWISAFGSADGISGVPDKVGESDSLAALLKVISDIYASMYKTVLISGEETVITWTELGFSPGNYQVFIEAAGNYPEFLQFGYSIESDGIHIFPHRLVDGEIVNSTRRIKWGSFRWGAIRWNAYSSMNVNLNLREVDG